MNVWRTLISIILLAVVSVSARAQDVSITASVDHNPVGLNDQFTYQVEVSGSAQNLPDVQLPDFGSFAVLGGPSVSSSFQIVNFNMSASKTYTMTLMPRNVGTFKIGAASASFKGKDFKSNSVDVTVVKQSAQNQPIPQNRPGSRGRQSGETDQDLSKILFLKAIPSKRSPYVNEEVTLSYKIYFRANITNNEVSKLPEAVGCWVEDYPIPQRPKIYTETLNGVQYNVAEIRKVALFPSRAGKITVSPMELIVETVIRQRSRNSRDLFDSFFNDPFGQVVKKRLSSGPVVLNVKPVPEAGKPADYSGLVGDFKIHSSLDKNAVQANEAVSYKVKISGSGLLKFLNKLPVEFSPDFEVYDPKVNENMNKSGARMSANKEFEYVVIPRLAGQHRIKAFSLSYFNPADRRYHEMRVPEYSIDVSKGKDLALGSGSGAGLSKEEVRLLGSDIHFIKEEAGDFKPIGRLPYMNWWFYLSLILPVGVLGMAWIYRNHLEKMSTNVEYARSRKAHKQAQMQLREAKTLWKQGKGAEFYGAVSRGLTGYVADKTNQSAAGLVRDDVLQILGKSRVEDDLRNQFLTCLDEADFRRFAPGNVQDGDMKQFYDRAENILVKLEKYF